MLLITCQSSSPDDSTQSIVDISAKCNDKNLTQLEMNQCFSNLAEAEALRMELLIEELQAHMSANKYSEILEIQDSWKIVTEDFCLWQRGFYEGGSIAPTIYYSCLASEYETRLNQLKFHLCDGAYQCPASEKFNEP